MSDLILELPIEEYFRYHPPQTDERKAAHERANNATLELCQRLSQLDPNCDREIDFCEIIDSYTLVELCEDKMCKDWIKKKVSELISLVRLYLTSEVPWTNGCFERDLLMILQQIRMFANQGITLDELKKMREAV